jgi:hypothetical protein
MLKMIVFILVMPIMIFAQEFNATVILDLDQLNPGTKEKVEKLQSALEDYLNKNKFSGQAWRGEKIQCLFKVVFTASSDNNDYTTQLIVSSYRPVEGTSRNTPMMIVLDSPWAFQYEKNRAMYFNQIDIDAITSMLDYYAYLILGFDADSFQKMGGTDFFKKAYDIALRGGSSKSSSNWAYSNAQYTKRGLLEDLLDERYIQFRNDYFNYHYNGIDLINDPKKHDLAISNIIALINNLSVSRERMDSRSVLLKVFFDAKVNEICDALKNYPDKSIFSTLKKVDPYHISKYVEMSGK